jgi:Spy/CpxP family protein refolding chaperone
MNFTLNSPAMGRLTAMLLMAVLVLAGCGNQQTITATDSGSLDLADVGQLVEDPLDGAFDSTDGFTPAEAGPRIDRLAELLGLSDEQKAALAAAYLEFRDAHEALRDLVRSGELTHEEAFAEAADLRDAFEAEVQIILTPEQYDLFQELRAGKQAGRDHPGRGMDDRWAAWLVEIGADEAQTAAVLEALATFKDGVKDLRDSVRAGDLTREEARDQTAILRDQFDADLQAILTAEQYEQLLTLRPDCAPKTTNPPGGGVRS